MEMGNHKNTREQMAPRAACAARHVFTLIELLVVITIIGILASMLLPTLLEARERGRRAVCMANLDQLAVGIHVYADDWDGVLPSRGRHYWNWGNLPCHKTARARVLLDDEYIQSADSFVCPSLPKDLTFPKNFGKSNGGTTTYEGDPDGDGVATATRQEGESHELTIDWVEADEVKARIPGINPTGLRGGTFSPDDGQVSGISWWMNNWHLTTPISYIASTKPHTHWLIT